MRSVPADPRCPAGCKTRTAVRRPLPANGASLDTVIGAVAGLTDHAPRRGSGSPCRASKPPSGLALTASLVAPNRAKPSLLRNHGVANLDARSCRALVE